MLSLKISGDLFSVIAQFFINDYNTRILRPLYSIKLPKFLILRPLYKFYSQNFFHPLYAIFTPNFGFLRPLFGLRPGASALPCPLVTPLIVCNCLQSFLQMVKL